MHVNELKNSLALLTKLVEADAAKVTDMTQQNDSSDYEFFGFKAFANLLAKEQPTDEEEILRLLDALHEVLAKRLRVGPMHLRWKLKPELIWSGTGIRIGCRCAITPTIALVKKPELVS